MTTPTVAVVAAAVRGAPSPDLAADVITQDRAAVREEERKRLRIVLEQWVKALDEVLSEP